MGRQLVMDQLKERIRLISPDNGYTFTPKAYEWMVGMLDDADLPAVVVKDKKSEIEDAQDGSRKETLSVEIELYTCCEDAEPERLRQMTTEMMKALYVKSYEEDMPVGDFFIIDSVDMNIVQEKKKYGLVTIDARVIYHEETTSEWR